MRSVNCFCSRFLFLSTPFTDLITMLGQNTHIKLRLSALILHVWNEDGFGLGLEENRKGNWKLLQSLSHAL